MLEGARAEPRDLQQFLAAGERPGRVAMRDDRFGQRRAKAGNARQQRRRGGVEIDADGVHAHLRPPRPASGRAGTGRHRAGTGRRRCDFGSILTSSASGSCSRRAIDTAPRSDTSRSGKFRRGGRRGRIDRGAGFADDHLERLRACRHVRQHVGDQLFGLAAAGAVADRDQLDLVLADQRCELGLRAAHIVPRRERIDGRRRQQLAGAVDDRDLDAGADAGIEPHGRARAGGGGEQQILEIAGEDMDRLFLGPLAQVAHQIERQMQREFDAPGPAGDLHQPAVAGRAARRCA